MGLFDKKNCDICGKAIGLLGNRKLADGNCCKDCAAKLSPYFYERKQSTVEDIKKQLDANKGKTDFSLRIVEKGGVFYSDFSNFSTKINPEEFVKSFSLPVKYKIELKK